MKNALAALIGSEGSLFLCLNLNGSAVFEEEYDSAIVVDGSGVE